MHLGKLLWVFRKLLCVFGKIAMGNRRNCNGYLGKPQWVFGKTGMGIWKTTMSIWGNWYGHLENLCVFGGTAIGIWESCYGYLGKPVWVFGKLMRQRRGTRPEKGLFS